MFKNPEVTKEFYEMREEIKKHNPSKPDSSENPDDKNEDLGGKNDAKFDFENIMKSNRNKLEENFVKISEVVRGFPDNIKGDFGAQQEEMKQNTADLKKGLEVAVASTQEIWQKYGIDLNAWAKNSGKEAGDIKETISEITKTTQQTITNISSNVIRDLSDLDIKGKTFEENQEILKNSTEKNLNELRDTLNDGISKVQSQFYEEDSHQPIQNVDSNQSTENSDSDQSVENKTDQSDEGKNSNSTEAISSDKEDGTSDKEDKLQKKTDQNVFR